MPVAEIQNLRVQYGSFVALDEFTATIPEACIGLLGPNGAGKSTLIKTLLGLVRPANGSASVFGIDTVTQSREVRRIVGYMPEQDCHIPGLTGVGFVAYAGELAGMSSPHALRRAHEVLEYCGLGEARYRNVETFSTGMKQRVKLAQALVHGPKLLLLDEPTNGLDPRGRDEMLSLIADITRTKGISVIISSHLLPDIERTCSHIMVVFQGRLRAAGAIDELTHMEGLPVDVELREPSDAFVAAIKGQDSSIAPGERGSYRIQFPGLAPSEVTQRILQSAHASGAQVRAIKAAHRSLEDAFLEVIR